MTFKKNRILSLLAMTAAVFCLCGCESILKALDGTDAPPQDATQGAGVAATYFGEPKVRPGVMLAISVTATGLSGREAKQYPVDPEGYITMELVGKIACNDLTLVDLQKRIVEAYKKYYKEPNVTVTFVYQPGGTMVSPWGTVTVLGEVHRQGPVDVPSTRDLRVLKALQLAGGVTSIADKRRVQVTRCDKDGKQTKTRVDIQEIGEEGRADKDMLLRAGDVIWVPMSWY